ncbi:MAG: hypothetical protein Q9191_001326 [Dirinaria sp. TL-2023a]
MRILATLSLFLGCVLAKITSKSILITYDDIDANPLVSATSPVPNPYKGLDFLDWRARANGVSILKSQSGNNTISAGGTGGILSGSTTPPNITSQYDGSNVVFYDLVSTYFGCAVSTAVSTGAPQPCTLQFQGFKIDGSNTTVLATFDANAKPPKLSFVDFKKKLNGVKSVTVTVAASSTVPLTTVEFLDTTKVVEYVKS